MGEAGRRVDGLTRGELGMGRSTGGGRLAAEEASRIRPPGRGLEATPRRLSCRFSAPAGARQPEGAAGEDSAPALLRGEFDAGGLAPTEFGRRLF